AMRPLGYTRRSVHVGGGVAFDGARADTSANRPTRADANWLRSKRRSNLHPLEVFLTGPAIRTPPRQRHVVPARARRETLLGQALLLVVHETADQTHPALVARARYRFFHRSSCRFAARMISPMKRAASRAAQSDPPSRGRPAGPRGTAATPRPAGNRPRKRPRSPRPRAAECRAARGSAAAASRGARDGAE